MMQHEDASESRFERELKSALDAHVTEGMLARRVLERIDGRSPREMSRLQIFCLMRSWSAAAAVLLFALVLLAVGLGSGNGEAAEPLAEIEDAATPIFFEDDTYLAEYSSESTVFNAMFILVEEMTQ